MLRIPVGPPGVEVIVRFTLPWKKLKLSKFRVIVAFEPVEMLAEVGVAVMLKSVATIVRTIVCESVPSSAVMMIR